MKYLFIIASFLIALSAQAQSEPMDCKMVLQGLNEDQSTVKRTYYNNKDCKVLYVNFYSTDPQGQGRVYFAGVVFKFNPSIEYLYLVGDVTESLYLDNLGKDPIEAFMKSIYPFKDILNCTYD